MADPLTAVGTGVLSAAGKEAAKQLWGRLQASRNAEKQFAPLVEPLHAFIALLPHIERELMMIKVRAERNNREELKRLTDIFRAKIIDVTDTSFVVELTGASRKLDAFIDAVPEGLIVEVVRTGPSGISRGERGLTL